MFWKRHVGKDMLSCKSKAAKSKTVHKPLGGNKNDVSLICMLSRMTRYSTQNMLQRLLSLWELGGAYSKHTLLVSSQQCLLTSRATIMEAQTQGPWAQCHGKRKIPDYRAAKVDQKMVVDIFSKIKNVPSSSFILTNGIYPHEWML